MATPVPYEGAPDKAPGFEAIQPISVRADPNAFGLNIAEAASHLGQVTEGAGKELFDRAYAMQELQAQANVNARLTSAQNRMTDISAKFNSLEGNNAVQGLDAARQGLDQARIDGGAGLSPYEQRLYDTESRGWQFRIGNSMAGHSAEQLKRYTLGAAQSQSKTADDLIGSAPKDDATYQAAVKQKIDSINHTADILGVSDDQRKQMLTDGVSDSLLKRAATLSEDDPFAAKALLNKAIANKQVVGDQVEKVAGLINERENAIGGRHIAAGTMSGAHLQFGEQPVGMEPAQQGIKAIEGGNYRAIGPTTKTGGHGQGAYQVMDYNLSPWLKEAGMPNMTPAEFRANPEAQDALFNFKFGQYMTQYGSFNRAAKAWFSGDPDAPMDKTDGYHTVAEYLQIANAGLAHKVPLATAVAEGRKQAQNIDPLNTDLQDRVQANIEAQYARNEKMAMDTEHTNDQTVYGAIYNGVGPDKKLPTSLEELSQNPDAKAAWDYMALNDPKKLGEYRDALKKNATGDVIMNEARMQQWANLSGMATNDPQAFMAATDVLSKVDLPKAQKLEIIRMRDDVYKKEDANPQLGRALAYLNQIGMLRAVGLTKDQDPDNLNLFSGILHDVMTQYAKDNGKPMGDEEIKTTAQSLLTSIGGGTSFWHPFGGGQQYRFQSIDTVPTDQAASIAQKLQAKGVMPSEQAIHSVWLAAQYRDLYGQKTKTNLAPSGKPWGPKHAGGWAGGAIIPDDQ